MNATAEFTDGKPRTFSWTRRWMFRLARWLVPAWQWGWLHCGPGDSWLVQLLYGPRVQRFTNERCRAGWRWGGAVLGLEWGDRGGLEFSWLPRWIYPEEPRWFARPNPFKDAP